jgi:O-antigen ligase
MQAILKNKKLLNYFSVVIVIILAYYIGSSIVEAGKIRVRVFALFLPLLFIWILNLSDVGRFRLLTVAPLLVFLQMPKIPFRFSVSELMLIMLAGLHIPAFQLGKKKTDIPKVNYLALWPYVLFAFAGFITAVLYGGLGTWQVFCVIPLLWMYVAMNMVHSPEDAFKLIKAAAIGVLICLCIYQFANFTGHVAIDGTMGWRMGTQLIIVGPIHYQFYSCTFCVLMALGFVVTNMLVLQDYRSMINNYFYGMMMLIFAFAMVSSGARAGTVAAVAGVILMLLLNKKTFKVSSLKYFCFMILIALLVLHFQSGLAGYFDNQLNRFNELFEERITGVANYKVRMLYLGYAIDDVIHNPFGNGFGYMWSNYRFDDAIVYVYLLEGTGILGTIAFLFIVAHMFIHFAHNLIGKRSESQKWLASLGIGMLTTGLLAGIASESIMAGQMHSFVFWAILAACFAGTQNKSELPEKP